MMLTRISASNEHRLPSLINRQQNQFEQEFWLNHVNGIVPSRAFYFSQKDIMLQGSSGALEACEMSGMYSP
jgi:hypothetical protein